MQFERNPLTTTARNSSSQNKKTVQTVLILGLSPHHGSCHVFSLPVERSVPEQRASNAKIHPVLWHLQGLSFTSVILPCSQTFFDSPSSSAWYFRPSTLTSAGLSSVLSHQSTWGLTVAQCTQDCPFLCLCLGCYFYSSLSIKIKCFLHCPIQMSLPHGDSLISYQLGICPSSVPCWILLTFSYRMYPFLPPVQAILVYSLFSPISC